MGAARWRTGAREVFMSGGKTGWLQKRVFLRGAQLSVRKNVLYLFCYCEIFIYQGNLLSGELCAAGKGLMYG